MICGGPAQRIRQERQVVGLAENSHDPRELDAVGERAPGHDEDRDLPGLGARPQQPEDLIAVVIPLQK